MKNENSNTPAKTMQTTSSGIPFTPRLTKPGAGNKYYITKSRGGYSDAIQGSPTDRECNVLANCVGYAYGRFNEIGGYGECRYLRPTNAENFIESRGGLEIGQEPRLGACMVWQKGPTLGSGDGVGHVAIVEKILSPTQVITSESGWKSSAFWTQNRQKGNGNWGAGAGYKFRGFIYNPAVDGNSYVVEGSDVIDVGYSTVSARPLTFADLGIDESLLRPYIVAIDPDVTNVDYGAIKELKACGMMFFAGQRFNSGNHTRRPVFRSSNLIKQVESCQDAGLVFALYTNVLARNKSEALEEIQQLYYTVSRYPPGLGLWLALKFPPNQSKATNHTILDTYYEKLTEFGLAKGCGLYVTPGELEKIDWENYQDRFQLWVRDYCSQEEADSIDIVVEPSFFKLDESGGEEI